MRTRRAFTLVELMVTIGIIALLASIVLVVSVKAMGTGRRVRAQADLQSISTALEAYKQDFGDYPRALGTAVDINDGAWVLARAIVAPGPAAIALRPLTADGADGNGFRVRPGGQGRVYGPYISPDKFTVFTFDNSVPADPIRYYLIDKNFSPSGRQNPPVLYLPRNTKTTITPAQGYLGTGSGVMYDVTPITQMTLGADPSWTALATTLLPGDQIRTVMGDLDRNGVITNGETAPFTGPYILWMAGPDGMFGLTNESGKRDIDTGRYQTDDIANFNFDSAVTVK